MITLKKAIELSGQSMTGVATAIGVSASQMSLVCSHNYTDWEKKGQQMKQTKSEIIQAVYELQEVLAGQYGVKIGSRKTKTVTVSSFDGNIRITVDQKDVKSFDDRINLAKVLIDGCITKWSSGANANLRAIVDQAFELNQSGRMKIGSILALRRLNIVDDDWEKAMDIIADSYQSVLSREYFRVYKRVGKDSWSQVDLDMSTL